MEVILLEAVQKLGQLGDTVKVKPGYARNYLIPQKKAVKATAEALAKVEERRAQLLKEEKERLDVAQARADAAVKTLRISKHVVNETGKLFGSVSTTEIIDKAAEAGTEILRSEINMPGESIKETGEHVINIRVHPDVSFDINLTVEADSLEPSVDALIEEGQDSAEADEVHVTEDSKADEVHVTEDSEPDEQNSTEEITDK